MRCANLVRFRLAPYWLYYDLYRAGWRVAVFFLRWRSLNLDKLGVIDPRSQAHVNRVKISWECVRRNLKFSARSLIEFLCEGDCVPLRAASEVPRKYELCVALDCDEAIGVSALRVARVIAFFLASDESPHFVALNVRHRHIADLGLQEPLAAVSSQQKNLHNGILVDASDSLD